MSEFDAAWAALNAAADRARTRRIASLFDHEPGRLAKLTVEAAGLTLDLSKQPWSLPDLGEMLDLARTAGVEGARARLFGGEVVNRSEGRPASRSPAKSTSLARR